MSQSFPDLTIHSLTNAPLYRLRTCRYGVMAYLVQDITIGRALEMYGEFAESENQLMTALLQPGDVALDVGANVGTVALPLARKVGPTGFVYLFEPQPLIFQALCTTLTLNGITHAKVHRTAVGSQTGEVFMPHVSPTQALNYGAIKVAGSNQGESTPLITIDSLRLARCNLIKIDVEGMDFEVLLGATETVARCRPHVYMEAKTGIATQQAIAWLQARNYACYWHFAMFFSPHNFRQVSENIFGNSGDINLLALPQELGVNTNLPRIASPQADWQADYQAAMSRGNATS
jgi:FkbM family methyltransferase